MTWPRGINRLENVMPFARSAPTVLITSALIVVALLTVVNLQIVNRMTRSAEEGQFAMMAQILQAELKGAENRSMAGAELLAALPSIREAFAGQQREALLALTQSGFQVQKEKFGISQAQFHSLPSTSFLRVHNPAKFGEDLSSYRQMVVDVNRNRAGRKGIEITTSGIGVFGTVPMSDMVGSHTGSFEMACEFGPLLDRLKAAYGFEMAVLIDEKTLKETATSLKGEVFNDVNRVGRFIRFSSTHTDLLKELVTPADVNLVEEVRYIREALGVPYGVLLQPLYNYAHQQIGVIAVSRNFHETRSAAGRAFVWQMLLALLCGIALIGSVLIVVRGLLLGPLVLVGQSLAALADGESSPPVPDADPLCPEMKAVIESVQRIRDRSAGPGQGGGNAA